MSPNFVKSNVEKVNELAEINYLDLCLEMRSLKKENELLRERVIWSDTLYSNLLEKHAEKISQVEFLEDSYIETYAELCRLKWLHLWKNMAGDLYEDYENAEAVCRVFEKAWENSSFIMCASYSIILSWSN